MTKIFMNRKYQFVLILIAVFLAGAFFSNSGIAQKVKLNPIKPVANQTAPLTDEQQAIAAVRTAKASVVNIVGVNDLNSSPDQPSIAPLNIVAGTGVIIDSNGLIISNSHVVSEPNSSYDVVFSDGAKYPARVLGTDSYSDIALLKIDAAGLQAAKLGNSDSLETGQTVFAIGNSLGKYQNTVTRGVISGLGRNVAIAAGGGPVPRLQDLIQTDAAINPGNSGGPLINLAGEVIGINTVIDNGGQGLGFAIPINVFKSEVDDLKILGKVSHAFLGISFLTIDKGLAAAKNLGKQDGALIVSVVPASPAASAGIIEGDIIVAIDGSTLNTNNQLDKVIQKYKTGNKVTLAVFRDGQILYLQATLTEYQQ